MFRNYRGYVLQLITESLHDLAWIPVYGVVVESSSRVEPRIELHFSVSHPLRVDVGVDDVGLAGHVAEEFEVDLVMLVPCRRHLDQTQRKKLLNPTSYILCLGVSR